MPTHPIEGDTMTIALPEVDTIFGRIRAFPGDLITEQLVSFGAHTRPELAFLLNMVDEGDGVFDLGAHIGTFALPIARKVGLEAPFPVALLGGVWGFDPADPPEWVPIEAELTIE